MRRWQTIVAMFTSASLAGCVYLTIEYKEAAAPSDPFALKISHGDPIGRVIGEEPPHRPFSSVTAVEYLRPDAPDCGMPGQPMTFYPGLGGDLVTITRAGNVDLFDAGDSADGPTPQNHDRLILPGFPSDAEVLVRNGSVAFCFPKHKLSVLLVRQMCSGDGWNNAYESISFTGGVSFVMPEVLAQLDGPYMTEERARQMSLDWLSEKALANWAVYTMPPELLSSAEALEACAKPIPGASPKKPNPEKGKVEASVARRLRAPPRGLIP